MRARILVQLLGVCAVAVVLGTPAAASASTGAELSAVESPGAPVVLAVTATTARLAWAPPSRPTAPIIGYDVVQASTTPMGPTRVLVRTTGRRPAATVTGLTPGATYPIYVVARYPAYGSSPDSPQVLLTTAPRS